MLSLQARSALIRLASTKVFTYATDIHRTKVYTADKVINGDQRHAASLMIIITEVACGIINQGYALILAGEATTRRG